MLRSKRSIPRPLAPQKKAAKRRDSQNIGPFNTRGYFNPEQPYDEQYLQAKQKAFARFRSKDQEYVMLDLKNTVKAEFIQRGLSIQHRNSVSQCMERNNHSQRNTLLKNYLLRKEKRELTDLKYNQPINNNQILRTLISKKSVRSIISRTSNLSEMKNFE